MKLHVALLHAVSRHGENARRLGVNEIAVHLRGLVEINGEGVRSRHIGPVSISAELTAPFVTAVLRGDDRDAAREFEAAFAQSYGVGDIAISKVTQLEIVEAPG